MNPMFRTIGIGTGIMVYVDDAVESGIYDVIHDFLHSRHPCGIDVPVRVHVVIPCYRHSDCPETGIFHHRNQFGFCCGLSPAVLRLQSLLSPIRGRCDVCDALVVGIEGIAQIPSQPHVLYSLSCRLEILCLHLVAERNN